MSHGSNYFSGLGGQRYFARTLENAKIRWFFSLWRILVNEFLKITIEANTLYNMNKETFPVSKHYSDAAQANGILQTNILLALIRLTS